MQGVVSQGSPQSTRDKGRSAPRVALRGRPSGSWDWVGLGVPSEGLQPEGWQWSGQLLL